MPRLQLVLRVLEHHLDELVQVEPHHRRPRPRRRAVGPRRDAVPADDIGDVVVVHELERRVGDDERHAVDGVPALPGEHRRGVGEHQRPRRRDGAVVERPLRVGPRRARRQVPPERPRLVHRPLRLLRRRRRERAGRPGHGAAVVQRPRRHQRRRARAEPRGRHDGVVLRRLVERDEERHRLADMDVERVVHVLHRVRPLHLHQPQRVPLDPDIDGRLHPDIGHPEQVRPPLVADERRRRRHAIDEQRVGRRERATAAGVERLPQLLMPGLVPVADEEREVAGGRRVRDGDGRALVDVERAEAAGGAVHGDGGEVDEGADLVLGLELVGVVGARGDWAVGAQHAVLPRVLALLDAIPCQEERLVQVVEHVHDDVVVRHAVDSRPRKLAIDQDALRLSREG
ncbi:Os07g0119475 [Oryza sativa Japonica Group]|uniref:Os07g0119475 protein n=1 Tax=Oryza sativa subsp. japonica TaxID=39947 RepID=A0A0P0X277_ORYSJ|nr:hypothetical protein EE612_036843 [Oryza sativa]BAS99835.1 Os07g0119475 [Oryza sativa Japonica Group]